MCGVGIPLDQGTIMGTTEETTEKKLLIVCVCICICTSSVYRFGTRTASVCRRIIRYHQAVLLLTLGNV